MCVCVCIYIYIYIYIYSSLCLFCSIRTVTDVRTQDLLNYLQISFKESKYPLPISTAINFCIFPPLLIPAGCSLSLETPSTFLAMNYIFSFQLSKIAHFSFIWISECNSSCTHCLWNISKQYSKKNSRHHNTAISLSP